MATFAQGHAEHFSMTPGGGVQTRAFTFATPPTAGQEALILVYTANETQNRSTLIPTIVETGWSLRGSNPGGNFEGRTSAWTKTADGSETGVTIDFGTDDIDFGNTFQLINVTDGIVGSVLLSATVGSGGGPATYVPDSLDHTLHWGGFYGNVAPVAPAGDSVISTVDTATFRRSIVSESAGAKTISWAAGNAALTAIHVTDTTTSGPAVAINEPMEGELHEPGTEVQFQLVNTATGEQIDAVSWELFDSDRSLYFNTAGSIWQAAQVENEVTFAAENSPHNYTINTNAFHLNGTDYVARIRARGTVNGYGAYATRNFTTFNRPASACRIRRVS